MKRTIAAVAAGFAVLAGGRYLIHSVWLAQDYLNNTNLWRPQDQMLKVLWVIYLANFLFALGATLVYARGVESKPWLGQGLRFGVLLALVTGIPQSLIEYTVYSIPSELTIKWIIGEGGLAVLLGVVIAAIIKPSNGQAR
jgi:hypothetical protein